MAENPYKTPVDDRILQDTPVRLTRVWKRFLSLIEALDKRLAPQQARLYAGADNVPTTLGSSQWVTLPVRDILGGIAPNPVAMEIGTGGDQDRLFYRGVVANSIRFATTIYMRNMEAVSHSVGMQKNGDMNTRITRSTATARNEFAAPFIGIFDMEPNDYVELIALSTGVPTEVVVTTQVDAQHTDFRPGAA